MTKLTQHELTAEWAENKTGEAIVLTQLANQAGGPNTIVLHPLQLRAVCEKFGLLAADRGPAQYIATLERRLQAVRDRVEFLDNWLRNHSDHKHADLSYECTYSGATLDVADEFCFDIDVAQLRASARMAPPGVTAPAVQTADSAKPGATQPSLI